MKLVLRPVPGRGSRAGLTLFSGGVLRALGGVEAGIAVAIPPLDRVLAGDADQAPDPERRQAMLLDFLTDKLERHTEVGGEILERVNGTNPDLGHGGLQRAHTRPMALPWHPVAGSNQGGLLPFYVGGRSAGTMPKTGPVQFFDLARP